MRTREKVLKFAAFNVCMHLDAAESYAVVIQKLIDMSAPVLTVRQLDRLNKLVGKLHYELSESVQELVTW